MSNHLHAESIRLATELGYEIAAAGYSKFIFVAPTHSAEHVWISYINRQGELRRMASKAANFSAWLSAKVRTEYAAKVELERHYNLYLQRKQERESGQQSAQD